MEILPLELRKLGLTEKEVAVYLAGLALGPSSAQGIAKKAKITRPTVYQIIKSLEQKGLFSEFKQKGRRYFTAQSAETILGMLRTQKREIEEREREFVRIITALESEYRTDKGGIKEFRGKEGIRALKEKFLFTLSPEIFVLCSEVNLKAIKERERIYQEIKKRLGKIEVKEIYPKKIKIKSAPWLKRKFSPSLKINGTLILCDKIIFLPPQKQKGLLIDSELVADMFKSLFLSLWALI